MTKSLSLGKSLSLVTALALSFPALASAETPEAQQTYQDIQATLGLVPAFFKSVPEEGISAAWDEMKAVQLNPHTALDGKTKELIGLAVAAQVPCRYCVYFHTQASRLNGATDNEQKEAIAMAGITRHWSAVANGLQIDFTEFKQEIGRVLAYVKHPTATGAPSPITDAASAYKDIERTFGAVPTFLRRFPEEGIAPAWREMKSIQFNPATALSGKTKELIGLAVAAQIPCQYCILVHTEVAKLNGATDAEIREAVAMAAITRYWSTVLNGAMVDEPEFRKDVDQVIHNVKQAIAKAKKH